MNEFRTKAEEGQRTINDFSMQKAKLQTENGKPIRKQKLNHIYILLFILDLVLLFQVSFPDNWKKKIPWSLS